MLSGPLNTFPLTSIIVKPDNGPIEPGGNDNVNLDSPENAWFSVLIDAKLLDVVADLLNPAT